MTEMKIGSSYAGMANFSALATPVKEPGKLLLYAAAKIVRNGSGGSTAVGHPYCTMTFNALSRAQRDMLRTFCTGTSATVYIYIPSNDQFSTFVYYTGIMHWPVTEKWRANIVIEDLEIPITNLVVYTP